MSAKVKVRRVIENSKSGSPILLNFEHAALNKNVDINTRLVGAVYESDSLASQGKTDHSHLRRKQVVVVQGETDMTYIGSSDGPLNTGTSGLRTFLAIRHKNKLKVYESQRITVSPYVANRAHLVVKDAKQAEDADEKRIAAQELVRAFGSKKKRLSYERQEKNEINSEHMNESINVASESAVITAAIGVSSPASEFSITPPCNREVKELRLVYSLDDILTEEDLDGMKDMAEGWLNSSQEEVNSWRKSKQFSDYFFEMHRRLAPRKGDATVLHKAKLILYTELLICLMKLKFSDFRKKVLPVPTEFESWLVDKALSVFTVINAHKVRCRPDTYKDKTCCYAMVLVLLANDFLFDVQLMSTSLHIHINKLLQLARAVGITTTLSQTTKEYRGLLKFPLTKPIERRVTKKKQKIIT